MGKSSLGNQALLALPLVEKLGLGLSTDYINKFKIAFSCWCV